MAEPLLSVRGLRVEIATRRRPLVALDDVSFDIAAGEVLGVVGESGAGKSVTGMAVIGLIDPPLRLPRGGIMFARPAPPHPPPPAKRRPPRRRPAPACHSPP